MSLMATGKLFRHFLHYVVNDAEVSYANTSGQKWSLYSSKFIYCLHCTRNKNGLANCSSLLYEYNHPRCMYIIVYRRSKFSRAQSSRPDQLIERSSLTRCIRLAQLKTKCGCTRPHLSDTKCLRSDIFQKLRFFLCYHCYCCCCC